MKEINELENAEEILKLPNSWEERGIEKGKREVALEMIKEGFPFDVIAKVTHLDQEEIESIQKRTNG